MRTCTRCVLGFVVHADSSSVRAGDVKAMAAGAQHSMVLKNDGTVWATDWNKHGQLGDGSTTDKNSFAQVTGA